MTGSQARYSLAEGVAWAVHRKGLVLFDGLGRGHGLTYPEAAIWDLVSRGFDLDRVARMLGPIASLEPARARALVESSLEAWVDHGWLEIGEGGDG